MIQIQTVNAASRIDVATTRRLARQVRAAWRVWRGPDVPITIRLAGDAEIATLNARYRRKPKPTDVLSFPYHEHSQLIAGDVIIAVGVARRQARARRCTLAAEMLRLAIHGLAHLLGYDHHTRTDFAAMRAIEWAGLCAAES